MKNSIIIILLSFIFFGCPSILPNKYTIENCRISDHSFKIGVSFEPGDSVINVGDTVTITSSFPNILDSKETGESFVFDSVDFHLVNGFFKLDTLIDYQKGYHFTSNFEFIIDDSTYQFIQGNNYIHLAYKYSDDSYFLQYKFIPKKKGIFLFEFSSNINLTNNIKGKIIHAVDSECKTNAWGPIFQTNQGNNYKELLKESPTEYYNTKYYNEWSRFNTIDGAHCFKVE